jgi:division protein CdvB (Snf7/Vps24/ESCRT-III family)
MTIMTAKDVIEQYGEICNDINEFSDIDRTEYVKELIEVATKDGVDFGELIEKFQQSVMANVGWTMSDMRLLVDVLKEYGYPARIVITVE